MFSKSLEFLIIFIFMTLRIFCHSHKLLVFQDLATDIYFCNKIRKTHFDIYSV